MPQRRVAPSSAQRILDIDEELGLLRRQDRMLFVASVRAIVVSAVLVWGAWDRLGPSASESLFSFLLFGVVVVWGATLIVQVLEHLQRNRRLLGQLDAVLQEPVRAGDSSREGADSDHRDGTDEL